jgi:hypothetical protein
MIFRWFQVEILAGASEFFRFFRQRICQTTLAFEWNRSKFLRAGFREGVQLKIAALPSRNPRQDSLTALWKCATLKLPRGISLLEKVPRGSDNLVTHQRG